MSAGETKQKYGTILTATGKAAIANAVATDTLIGIKYIALGDGGGSEYYPGESQTALKNQVYQMPANSVYVDPDNKNWIVVEGLIPESAGGFTIREAAVKTETGAVIAVGSYPASYKPKLEEGAAVGVGFKFIMEVTNASVVNINIDPSTAYATIQFVNNKVANHAAETNAHGGTYTPTPSRLMYRNEDGRCQVADAKVNLDAVNLKTLVQYITGFFGDILPWNETKTYDYDSNKRLHHIVWASDNKIYVAEQPSGPGTTAGPQDPTTTTGDWLGLKEDIAQGGGGGGSGGGGVVETPIGGVDLLDYQTPPDGWMVANGGLITNASLVVPELVAALQLPENSFRLLSEEAWQEQRAQAIWLGIGGVKSLVLDLAADTVRIPDIRRMFMSSTGAIGNDSLVPGGVHGDAIRPIRGSFRTNSNVTGDPDANGNYLFPPKERVNYQRILASTDQAGNRHWFDSANVVPSGVVNMPRAFGMLGCVRVGLPAK